MTRSNWNNVQLYSSASSPNLITNGDFEMPAMTGNGDLHSNDAGFSLPGWSYSTANNTFLLEWGTGSPGANPYGVSRSETGRQAVIINYDGAGVGDAPLAQTFNTIAGHGLSEENLYHTNSPTQLRVDVAAASYVISVDKPAPSGVTSTHPAAIIIPTILLNFQRRRQRRP
jgi:hypothetical protein